MLEYFWRCLIEVSTDAGFYEFPGELECKSWLYYSDIISVSTIYQISLSLSLFGRVFKCKHSDFSCDRDLNEFLNLAEAVIRACGQEYAEISGFKRNRTDNCRFYRLF